MTRWGNCSIATGLPHLIDQVRTGRAEFFGPDEITRFDRLEAQRGYRVRSRLVYIRLSSWMNLTLC